MSPASGNQHRVLIVGGGFGGLVAARSLRKVPVDVTLVDRRNFHLFQPLLYQVATGALSPAHIAAPLRGVLRRQKNCTVYLAEVVDFDPRRHVVVLADGELPYDTLIVAAGSTHSYFGHDEWAPYAPGLKSIEDATEMRRRILYAFERAEREPDVDVRRAWMTFVVVGGGPTGVELAGALSEIAWHTLRHDFRNINPTEARLILVDAGDRVISNFPPDLSERAARDLQRLRVDLRTDTKVTNVEEGSVTVMKDDRIERIESFTVLWAAGVHALPLARKLGDATDAEVDRGGRISVRPDCSVPGYPDIFAIGDMAHAIGPDGQPYPGLAPVAMQQAAFVARIIKARIAGKPVPDVFHYRDRGTMATIGRSKAVAHVGDWKWKGTIAWLMWLFVHLMELVQFSSRVAVLLQWAWSYFTYDRTARLITGKTLPLKTKVPEIGVATSIGDPGSAETNHRPPRPADSVPGEPESKTQDRVEQKS